MKNATGTDRDKKPNIRLRYSDDLSRPFWKRVQELGDNRWRVYQLGCILQTIERFTIVELERAEEQANKKRKSRGR